MPGKRAPYDSMAFERERNSSPKNCEGLFEESWFIMKRATYAELKYSIRIFNNGDGMYTVEVPKLPGCYSTGRSKNECIANVVEAIELHLDGLRKKPPEDPIPSIECVEKEPSFNDYLLSLPEACKFLDISDSTLRRYIKDGRVPAYNFGKEYKFKIHELSDFINSTRIEIKNSVKTVRNQRVG